MTEIHVRPNRLKTITGGPQGKDKKIVLLIPTVGDMRAQRKETQQLIKDFGDSSEEVEVNANQYIANHIVQWDWENDEGNTWPLPRTDLTVLSQLTQEEINFIAQAMAGQTPQEVEDRKK